MEEKKGPGCCGIETFLWIIILGMLVWNLVFNTESGTQDLLDPPFKTCAEAIAAEYGPYTKDDPEYHWYEDEDINGDGKVCEKEFL